MHTIKYLEHKEIDQRKWDAVIDRSPNAMIYAYSWYLDALCDEQWSALVLGDYEAVFPLPWRKKFGIYYIYQPFFCQQLGLFGDLDTTWNQDVFIDLIPSKFKKIHLQLNSYFEVKNYRRKRTNYILSMQPAYENIRNGYKEDAIKNLRKSKNKQIDFVEGISAAEVLQQYKEAWGELHPAIQPEDYRRFLKACDAAAQKKQLLTIAAYDNTDFLGAALFFHAPKQLHYLISAPANAGRKWSIMHGIIDFIIRKYAGQEITLDFEGSEISEVARFYEKWGAQKTAYYLVLKRRWW